MLGDVTDITGRLRAVLPNRWFPDVSPNLTALLGCLATPWSWLYSQFQYVIAQTRLSSATDRWLDLIAFDFFGDDLLRENGESDAAYKSRIQWTMLQSAATRTAITGIMNHLTGFMPVIFEPSNAGDTGAYGAANAGPGQGGCNLAYGAAGGWGNLNLPFQFFATVQRPRIEGVSYVSGYGTGAGGYGIGAIAYVDIAMLVGNVSDGDIASALSAALPVNTTAWLRLI